MVLCGAVIKEMTNLRCGRNRFCCGRLAMGSGATFAAAATVATLIAEITGRLAGALVLFGPDQPKTRRIRDDLVRRLAALEICDGC